MRPGISSYVFLQHRLHTGLLDAMHRGGATAIEIFAARHHFDYTDRPAIRELARWFGDTGVHASLHQPLYADAQWSRHVAPALNLIDPEKSRRIQAMDETKRAIESAEQIPFRSVVLHLGLRDDIWSPRSIENSLTAIEHLKAFAGPLGVRILLENLPNEVATPEHLLEIIRIGHFDNVGICLDLGHVHLADFRKPGTAVAESFELLRPRIAQLHLHDNAAQRDEHLWPGTTANGLDWDEIHREAATLPPDTPGILEINHELNETAESVTGKASEFFSTESRRAEQLERADSTPQ